MKSRLIYSDQYDFNFPGLKKIHPFDGMKFTKAWALITAEFKNEINDLWVKPETLVADETLLKVHTKEYLDSLNKSSNIAKVIEIGLTKFVPVSLLRKILINPIKLATQGTILSAEHALKNKEIVMNIGGGYHHAFAGHGEGFCFFAEGLRRVCIWCILRCWRLIIGEVSITAG